MSRSFEISTRKGKKGKNCINCPWPVESVGIGYKIVCVNDFHAENGLPSLEQKVKKESN